MSFYDELKSRNERMNQTPVYADEVYLKSIIDAIKFECRRVNYNYSQRHTSSSNRVSGYLAKHDIGEGYGFQPACYFISDIGKKKRVVDAFSPKELYYPDDPNCGWEGMLFDFGESTKRKIEEAFYDLGFPRGRMTISKVEIERGTTGFMHRVTWKKTGQYAYLIYVDIQL